MYLLPVALYAGIVIILDPLKCFRSHNEYYGGSFVSPNRENVCLNLFEKVDSGSKINSFIFGNSCSHAFKINNWISNLPNGSKGFHLDAYRETVYGILKKLEYLEKKGNSIKNVLIIMDRSTFSKKLNSYMYVMPKKLDVKTNQFYIEHLKAMTSIKFVGAYIYYALFHENLPFMEAYQFSLTQPRSDDNTGDLFYWQDEEIRKDSLKFFTGLSKKDWTKRINLMNLIGNDSFEGLTVKNIAYLKSIENILVKNQCNYKIVINPLFTQEKLPPAELNVLQDIYGAKNVYDFSGINDFTSRFDNYYDGLHYRPLVANNILAKIYAAN